MSDLPQNPSSSFRLGFISILPITIGIIPFGMITGITGINSGLSALEITLISAMVYAGASQLVALQLMNSGASLFFIVLAVVNLRYIMYSSTLANILRPLPRSPKALAAFGLVDQNFAMTLNHSKDQRLLIL